MNVGELKVHVENNAVRLRVTQNDVEDVEMFNVMLFRQLLKLMKEFMMVDKDNEENSYFMVPTHLGKMMNTWEGQMLHERNVPWCDALFFCFPHFPLIS
jgi:transcription initiation factor IIE alpha subunit